MSKRIIDLSTWKGRKHFEWFKKYEAHYYGITKKVKITSFLEYLNTHEINNEKISFFIASLFLMNNALNNIEEMRLRVENDNVVLYDIIEPAYLIMTEDGIYDNCEHKYFSSFKEYYFEAKKAIEKVKKGLNFDKPYNDLSVFNQYYFTTLPWISFSSIIHPMINDESSFVPRICTGKYYKENDDYFMDINIQVSHCLVDGYPLSKAFLEIEQYFSHPELLECDLKENN